MALKSLRVVEMAGLAPGPFCGMILADHGASVIRVDKIAGFTPDSLSRGKRSIALDLKRAEGVNIVKKLCKSSDVLIEPFRKGVMEKLGLGPEVLCKENPKLIYARLTGYGQSGPYSNMAGHDINYIATSGVLSRLGRTESNPHAPVNLLADFGGGGLMCALGITLALFERSQSGKGQIIDANMVHGSAYLSSFLWSSLHTSYGVNLWDKSRGQNLLDGGAPFYDTFKTKDDKFMAVGALEPNFYKIFLSGLGLDEKRNSQFSDWDSLRSRIAEAFLTKTQAEWSAIFDQTDSCVTAVVQLEDVHKHEHNAKSFIKNELGNFEPSPAPELSRTPAEVRNSHQPKPGEHTSEILLELGLSSTEISLLIRDGVVEQMCSSKL